LKWDAKGDPLGTLEVWCVAGPNATPAFSGSGLTYNVGSQTYQGSYTQCP
ncbi:MAG: hypothetical protein JWM74_3342, partial [Myxococcaceae bacterium]|nr:hypothetical protein [Myxococcaceae bacterium]